MTADEPSALLSSIHLHSFRFFVGLFLLLDYERNEVSASIVALYGTSSAPFQSSQPFQQLSKNTESFVYLSQV